MQTTVSTKGQVVIPSKHREALGITPGSTVEFVARGNVLELKLVRQKTTTQLADGHGMLRHTGKSIPVDFDVANLLKSKK